VLEEISGKLDTLTTLSKIGQAKELTLMREQVLGKSNIRRRIYNMCNGENTMNEIATSLKVKLPNVSKEIGILEQSGLVILKKVGKSRYPVRSIQ
jgi:DNA-binding MarR family transcriptional regulator